MLMDAIELRDAASNSSRPFLVPYGFVYQAGGVDRGSGGLYAHGGFARANRSLEFSARHALGDYRTTDREIHVFCYYPELSPRATRSSSS
jgi:hypothetical protein